MPPSSDSARARNASGTRVVMNEWRARPKAAAQKPMRKTDAANTPSDGAKTIPTTPTIDRVPAIAMVRRSPMRATVQPAGMLPHELSDDERRGDEGGGRDIRSELCGDDRDERDDGALAECEEHGRPVDHRPEPQQHADAVVRRGSRHSLPR